MNEMNSVRAVETEVPLSSNDSQLTDDEVDVVEFCFKGLGSEVHVSDSAINLYKRKSSCSLKAVLTNAETGVNSTTSPTLEVTAGAVSNGASGTSKTTGPIDRNNWIYIATGIPLLIRDIGQSKARSQKCLKIIVAERGSCFVLLHDVFDHLTDYQCLKSNFHSFRLSSNRDIEIGFEFPLENVAAPFLSKVNEWIATTDSVQCAKTANRKSKKHKSKLTSKRMPLPPKDTISQPCCFRHLISVDKTDDYFTLKKHFSSLF